MDTRVATTKIRIQQWIDIFQDRAQSGLKVDDYCEQHQLSRNSYYYWLRRVKEAALQSVGTKFVELEEPEAPVSLDHTYNTNNISSKSLTIQMNGAFISVNSDTSKELLTMVLGVVANVK
ncbi:IS66 family insertion sequence element accessory protein TnpB [Lacrimispora sp. BS-2]|uniref:IS66 family insertion sequence element accessory protein TnpB n=1 Tax=Lacrimispora sp. BS-2 TaxID=3151850 RepID=A0AAU7PLK8_9FIRM